MIKNNCFNTLLFQNILLSFFFFALLFPTFRVSIVGSQSYEGLFELIISALPEIFILFIVGFLLFNFRFLPWFRLKPIDWVIIGFVVLNSLYGALISGNLKLS